MIISLAIQSTYQSIEMGLYFDGIMKSFAQEHKNHASKNIIPLIGSLLSEQSITLADVSYIAVNQGPGPYTTLRVVIATVNGLAYATQKPIIGVDAFAAFAHEIPYADNPAYVLLDAFNKDVYYAEVINRAVTKSGCIQITELLQVIPHQDKPIHFFGNAYTAYASILTEIYPQAAFVTEPQYPQLQSVAAVAHAHWLLRPEGKLHISPLYLKEQKYKNQLGIMTAL